MMDFVLQISINGQVHNVGAVVRVSNHYMVGIVLGILAALVAGAVLAFVVMKHLRKKKKGGPLSVVWTLIRPVYTTATGCGWEFGMNYASLSTRTSPVFHRMYMCSSSVVDDLKAVVKCFSASMVETRLAHGANRAGTNNVELSPVGDYRRGDILAKHLSYSTNAAN